MELEKLFCEIDDFCVIFEETFKSQVIASQKQQRQRKSQLSLSETLPRGFSPVARFHVR
jgi:hypothetical protein